MSRGLVAAFLLSTLFSLGRATDISYELDLSNKQASDVTTITDAIAARTGVAVSAGKAPPLAPPSLLPAPSIPSGGNIAPLVTVAGQMSIYSSVIPTVPDSSTYTYGTDIQGDGAQNSNLLKTVDYCQDYECFFIYGPGNANFRSWRPHGGLADTRFVPPSPGDYTVSVSSGATSGYLALGVQWLDSSTPYDVTLYTASVTYYAFNLNDDTFIAGTDEINGFKSSNTVSLNDIVSFDKDGVTKYNAVFGQVIAGNFADPVVVTFTKGSETIEFTFAPP